MRALLLVLAVSVCGAVTPRTPLPLEFESNQGQLAPQVLFLASSGGGFVYLTRDGLTVGGAAPSLRMRLAGANAQAAIAGERLLPGVSNYLVGNDASQWHRGIPHYGSVRYSSVWPGIDLVLHGRDGALEYDFEVAPHADLSRIRFAFDGARLRIEGGDLVVGTSSKSALLRHRLPEIYQQRGGVRERVPGRFRISASGEVGFEVARYDRSRRLIIDPVLTYSTYLAGSGSANVNALALDNTGSAFLTGQVTSPDFPTSHSLQTLARGVGLYSSPDGAQTWTANSVIGSARVQSLAVDPKNSSVVYAGTPSGIFKTTNGGSTWTASNTGAPSDLATSIAIDPLNSNNVYAAFPEGLYKSASAGATWTRIRNQNITAVAVDPTVEGVLYAGPCCDALLKSTDGGTTWNYVTSFSAPISAIAVDPTTNLNVYAVSSLSSGVLRSGDGGINFTVSNSGLPDNPDVYAIAIDLHNASRLYVGTTAGVYRSTNGGHSWTPSGSGSGTYKILSLALDPNPLAPGVVYAGTAGGGILKSSDGGTTWTSVGPANLDANAIAPGVGGQSILAGLYSSQYAFVSKLSPDGSSLVYSTYIGGSGTTSSRAISADSTGAYICGVTDARDFPVVNALQPKIGGGQDIFVSRINSDGSGFVFSTYVGGHQDDSCTGIAVDGGRNILFAGNTITLDPAISNDYPITPGVTQPYTRVTQDCVIGKIDPLGQNLLYSTFLGGSSFNSCSGLAADSNGNAYVVGQTSSADFPYTAPPFGYGIPGTETVLSQLTGFITKLSPSGSSLVYSRLMGGAKGTSQLNAVTVDSAGRAYIAGWANASDYPLSSSTLATTIAGGTSRAVIGVIESDGGALVASSTLPGSGPDNAANIAVDSTGNIWVAGTSSDPQFPVTADALPHSAPSGVTPYAVQFDPKLTKLQHATLLGGSAGGYTGGIRVGSDGSVYVAGGTYSTDFTVTGTPFQTAKTAGYTLFAERINFAAAPPPANAPTITSVVNGASFANGAAVAPGSAITLMGSNFGTSGTTVSVNGKAIPLFYTSPTQINGQLPFETPTGSATVTVTAGGVTSSTVTFQVAATAPGIFMYGSNRAAVLNQDNSLNTSTNAATAGSFVTIYCTGVGAVDNPVPTGQPVPGISHPVAPVSVTIGGVPTNLIFAGLTPGTVSLAQVSVYVPNVVPGDWPVVVTVGGVPSNAPVISVQ